MSGSNTTPSPKSVAGTVSRKILDGQVLPHKTDPNKVTVEVEVDQGQGVTDWIPYDFDKNLVVDFAKQILRKFDPTVEEQTLDVLREIRDKICCHCSPKDEGEDSKDRMDSK